MRMISRRRLILSYTIQQIIPNICTKFQNPRFNSSWEIFDEKKVYTHTHQHTHKHCYWKDKNYIPLYTLYTGGIKIKGWISSSSLILVYTIHLPTVHLCAKFKPSRSHSFWEKCDEKFKCLKIGEKEKWRNKGMNKHQQADSGIHDTSVHCPRVY